MWLRVSANAYWEVTNPGLVGWGKGGDDKKQTQYVKTCESMLSELWGNYGPLFEIWFEGGALPPEKGGPNLMPILKAKQPKALVCGGPASSIRWIGNESGVGRSTEWSVISEPTAPDKFNWPDMQDQDLGSRAKLVSGSHLWWYPAEVNTSILHGWFWAPNNQVKTASELIDVYYQSVGRNGNMLLNLPPDTRGLIPDNQLASLHLMAQVVGETFAKNLAVGGTLTANTSNRAHKPARVLDGNLDTWWEAAPGKTAATLILKLLAPVSFDVVSLQEAVDHRGQRIETFFVDVWDGAAWKQMDAQTTVGHKRLLRWNTPVTTDRVRIRITGSRREPALAELGLFKQAELVQPPAIAARNINGFVTIACSGQMPAVYTTNGTMPAPGSARYTAPIALARGGTVNAACQAPDGRIGMIASTKFPGIAPAGWTVVAANGDASSAKAIDADPSTLWLGKGLPQSLTVDMGRTLEIGGLAYVPRSDGKRDGIVDTFRFETSTDGQHWCVAVADGRFGNIENNPVAQEVRFAPVTARFFRFTALTAIEGSAGASAAEIGVFPADVGNGQ